ncbi:MAG: PhzF family phenazine biosynthesis protein [Reichenbachiella sp.]|uniref:PhzF family phenazine biosynthesis protein n=1 Tax=Reichenbachiella sp. TaxID=2184521 RepID=UPI003297CA2D
MGLKAFIVDSFTNELFKGNPAGVCILDHSLDESLMQAVATEFNLSETAFVQRSNQKDNHYHIRYFTPTVEVDFCGHATLAASKVLLKESNQDIVSFTTYKDLELNAMKEGESVVMQFPLYDTIEDQPNQRLLNAFGISKPISVQFAESLDMLVIEVESKEALLAIKPDFHEAIKSSNKIKELVITAKSDDQNYNFYSRCFCPWIGIDEDPVTGASHSVLAKYWGQKLNKQELSAFQLSDRGGYLNLKIIDDSTLEVRSNAKIVLQGMLEI